MLDAGVSDLDYLKSRMRQSLANDAAAAGSDDEDHNLAANEGSAYGLEEAEGEDAAGSDEAGETAEAAVGAVHPRDSEPGATAEGASPRVADWASPSQSNWLPALWFITPQQPARHS